MSRKTNPVKKERKEKQLRVRARNGKLWKWTRNASLGIASAGILAFGAYKGLDLYADNQIAFRHQKFVEATKAQDDHVLEISGLHNKIRYLRRLDRAESEFDEYLPDLLTYLKTQHEQIGNLTSSDGETAGYIERSGKNFRLEKMHSYSSDARQYIGEALQGNFENSHLLDVILRHLIRNTKYGPHERQIFYALEVLEFNQLPAAEKLASPNFEVYKKSEDASRGLLELVRDDFLKSVSQNPGYISLMENPGIFSGWHTHPDTESRKTPLDAAPSRMDVGSTYIHSPEIVFSRVADTIRVYAINRGQVKEIYFAKIR
ncbi:MAG: hypothetical protein HY517_00590 [Candidatus Aenigmarchaeota archaeon]|nr:hypothetical protein [Candidatus Aenigmarchaeota archaeon]